MAICQKREERAAALKGEVKCPDAFSKLFGQKEADAPFRQLESAKSGKSFCINAEIVEDAAENALFAEGEVREGDIATRALAMIAPEGEAQSAARALPATSFSQLEWIGPMVAAGPYFRQCPLVANESRNRLGAGAKAGRWPPG